MRAAPACLAAPDRNDFRRISGSRVAGHASSGSREHPLRLLLGAFHRFVRLKETFDAILFRKRRAEEAIGSRVEKIGSIARNHMRRVWENTELAIVDVVVDLKRVLATDQIVITRPR